LIPYYSGIDTGIFHNPWNFAKPEQALKKNLQFGRRWSILADGFVDDDNSMRPGLGLGVLLLCGPSIKRKMSPT
jgi:hypothetical protein